MATSKLPKSLSDVKVSYETKFMFGYYIFLILIISAASALSVTENFIFKPYKRSFAPPGISTGQNESPYSPI